MDAPSSKYSLEEYLQLQQAGTKDLTRDQRLVLLALTHYTQQSARQLIWELNLNISHLTISRVQKHFELFGTLSKSHRSGQTPYFTPEKLKELESFITTNSTTRRLSYKEIAHQGHFDCGEDIVRQACKALGFCKCVPRQKQLLNARQKQLRYYWALDHASWRYDEWSRVIWTDEVSFSTDHTAYNVTVLRQPGEEYHADCVQEELRQGRQSVMVWGAFCGTTKSDLHIVKGDVSDTSSYTQLEAKWDYRWNSTPQSTVTLF